MTKMKWLKLKLKLGVDDAVVYVSNVGVKMPTADVDVKGTDEEC